MTLPFNWLKLELIYSIVVMFLYFTAFIAIFAGFGYCAAGNSPKCDARVAAGVRQTFSRYS